MTSEQEELTADESVTLSRKQVPRVPSTLEADDYIYVHGVSRIDSDDSPFFSPFPARGKRD